jgi:hypothetical protein
MDDVKKAIEEHAESRNHPDATLQDKGFVVLSNDACSDSEVVAATPKAVKTAYDLADTANQNASNAKSVADGANDAANNAINVANGATNLANTANNLANIANENSLPIGVPVPWPTENPPEGWLICNGDSFDKEKYPKLAFAYPSGALPDLRGEFIRGLDTGGAIDPGRTILSHQNFAFEDHALTLPTNMWNADAEDTSTEKDIYAALSDNFAFVGKINSNGQWEDITQLKVYLRDDGKPVGNNRELTMPNVAKYSELRTYKASTGWSNPNLNYPQTANETRPRNIAFNYIVRAA